MPIGLINGTAPTWENVTRVGQFNHTTEFMSNVNWHIYDGWLYFFLTLTLGIIIFMIRQDSDIGRRFPMNNIMVASAICSIIALLHRMIVWTVSGTPRGLVTDYQMWIFPVLTALLAAFLWATKPR